jgi:hypothetical protein
LKSFLAIVLGALFMMAAAFYNGYPIFFSDSHMYMLAGLESYQPMDHPMTYGYFIKIFSLGNCSLWPVIFIQALMLSWLIFLVVKLVLAGKTLVLKSLITIFFLSFFTGLSWAASQVMPDIFSPIAFLALFLIVYGNERGIEKVLLYFIFIISIAMHMSHVLLFTVIIFLMLLSRKWLVPQLKGKLFTTNIFALLIVTLGAIWPMRYTLQNSKSIVFMGAMAEQGILQKYLAEYCPTNNYMFCQYKDSIPDNGIRFLFDPRSPFNKLGGWTIEMQKECDDIVYGTLTTPKYIGLHIVASVKATCKQLYHFDIDDGNWSFMDSTGAVYSLILKYFKGESKQYINSRQSEERFAGVEFFKTFFRIVETVSALFILFLLIFRKKLFSGAFKGISIFFLITVVLNDWDLSTFSSVTDRYGCKVAWLIPFLAILAVFKLIQAKKSNVTLQ